MLNFLCFFVLFNAVKSDTKLTLHHMRIFFIISLTKIKFKIWRVTFFKSFLPLIKIWDGLPFFSQETIYHVRTEMRQSLIFDHSDVKTGLYTLLFPLFIRLFFPFA